MRNIELVNSEIERAQNQIAAAWDNDNYSNEEKDVVTSGFQMQLGRLLKEKSLLLPVFGATVVLPDGSEQCFTDTLPNDGQRILEVGDFDL